MENRKTHQGFIEKMLNKIDNKQLLTDAELHQCVTTFCVDKKPLRHGFKAVILLGDRYFRISTVKVSKYSKEMNYTQPIEVLKHEKQVIVTTWHDKEKREG